LWPFRRKTVDLQEALLHVTALLDKLPQSVIDRALEKIDLSDDAWEEAVQLLKEEVGWEDDEDSETDE
jgi:hypothetical protein